MTTYRVVYCVVVSDIGSRFDDLDQRAIYDTKDAARAHAERLRSECEDVLVIPWYVNDPEGGPVDWDDDTLEAL